MTDAPHIVVIGAGLGGLCLAQGLLKAGLNVTVYERDASATAMPQGYRISMDRRGIDALRACLPDGLYRLFEATCGQPSVGGSMFTSDGQNLKQERTLRFQGDENPTPGVPALGRAVDRLVLRETMLAGLDVHFAKEFTHYRPQASGIEAHFADGTSVTCDVLVAADGVSSRVRQQFLPDVRLVDTGIRWLGGRTVLDDSLRSLLPEAVNDCAVWVVDDGKVWFLAPVFFQRRPNDVAQELGPGLRFTDNDDFLMWALIGQRDEFMYSDAQLLGVSETELHALALAAVEDSNPTLKTFVHAATPDRGFSLAIRALPAVDPWPSSRITFLGDAIHASPVNGTGANAALEDAALVCDHLNRQHDTQRALDDYEAELVDRIRAMHIGLARSHPGITETMRKTLGNITELGLT